MRSSAGKRRHRITIQTAGAVASGLNTGQQDWSSPTTVCRPLASIEPLNGRESWQAQQVEATVTHRLRILYRTGITPGMRALFGSRVFHFDSILNREEANEELEILATEVVS